MRESNFCAEAGQQHASAYETHYTTKDIQKAFTLYQEIIAARPGAKEAGYSRSQIQNIVNAVVARKEIMDLLMELARTYFDPKAPLDAEPASA